MSKASDLPQDTTHPSLQGKAFCLRFQASPPQFPCDFTFRQHLPFSLAFCVLFLPLPSQSPLSSQICHKHMHPEVLLINYTYCVVFRYFAFCQRIYQICGWHHWNKLFNWWNLIHQPSHGQVFLWVGWANFPESMAFRKYSGFGASGAGIDTLILPAECTREYYWSALSPGFFMCKKKNWNVYFTRVLIRLGDLLAQVLTHS